MGQNCVLAKGGIKIAGAFTKVEQNIDVVKLFLNRSPTDVLEMNIGVGIRDMYVYGNDFVDRTLTRSLSMEFDWKRKPRCLGETDLKFEGEKHSHIYFDTVPWESVDDFVRIRECWESYNKDKKTCLKTREEYDDFARYVEARLTNEKVAKWLRRKDGDLHRLRQQFLYAWRHCKAGTTAVHVHVYEGKKTFPKQKLSHKHIAYILQDVGIPCSVTDVENSRKKEFIPNQTPYTDRASNTLVKLKQKYFYNLRIGDFFAEKSKLNINPVDQNDYENLFPQRPV